MAYEGLKDCLKTLFCVGALTVVVSVLSGARWLRGQDVYNGTIHVNNKRYGVRYEENRVPGLNRGSDNSENRMTLSLDDGRSYEFFDVVEETSIKAIDGGLVTKPAFEKDSLEFVVIRDGGRVRNYSASEVNDKTIDGLHAKEVFEKANGLYKAARAEIYDALLLIRQTELKRIE